MQKTISQLNNDDLIKYKAWETVTETIDDEEVMLTPAVLRSDGKIPASCGEVWCLCKATFANKSEHIALALCRGDANEGPLLWTVWNGEKDVSLMFPPAPQFVLDVEGPEGFAESFSLQTEDVFPIDFEVIPRFETPKAVRKVILNISGPVYGDERDINKNHDSL